MRLIDLLNKKVNGEIMPKKFKFNGCVFTLDDKEHYIDEDGDNLLSSINYNLSNLNDEVEIIEENKAIKKLNSLNNVGGTTDLGEFKDKQQLNNHILKDKINELIDAVNKLKEEK